MADIAKDKQAMLERKLQKMEAEIANLNSIIERLQARGKRDADYILWQPIALGIALYALILVLVKYL